MCSITIGVVVMALHSRWEHRCFEQKTIGKPHVSEHLQRRDRSKVKMIVGEYGFLISGRQFSGFYYSFLFSFIY